MRVPLLDLASQYRDLRENIMEAIDQTLGSGAWVLGPKVAELEKAIASVVGASAGIGVASGTDAILLSLRACGVEHGEEVICPPFTFFATAGATAANRIAKWDGSSWSPLGSGMVDWIWALTTFDDGSGGGPALYAGGKFAASPAVDSYLAKWGCDPNVDDAPGRP